MYKCQSDYDLHCHNSCSEVLIKNIVCECRYNFTTILTVLHFWKLIDIRWLPMWKYRACKTLQEHVWRSLHGIQISMNTLSQPELICISVLCIRALEAPSGIWTIYLGNPGRECTMKYPLTWSHSRSYLGLLRKH